MSQGKTLIHLIESYTGIKKKKKSKEDQLSPRIEKLLFIIDQISKFHLVNEEFSTHNDLLYLLSIIDEETKENILSLYETYCMDRDLSFEKLSQTLKENNSLKTENEFLINQLELSGSKNEIGKPIRLNVLTLGQVKENKE